MLARTFCASTFGVDAHVIEVEVNLASGMPRFMMVGLPDRAVSEARDRVESAIKNSGSTMPYGRLTVNLAPADLPKEGSSFDLPIAIGMLACTRQVEMKPLDSCIFLGELALNGAIRPVRGALPIAVEAQKKGFDYLIVPEENATEAAVVEGIHVLGVSELKEVIDWLNGDLNIDPVQINAETLFSHKTGSDIVDFSDVKGQENVKRAAEVAAAGGHNVIMVGPPGSGKTMIARRVSTILPPMSLDEALETTKIHSVAGLLAKSQGLVTDRPFRSPHHTVSDVALVGGGSIPMPGEISLAHNGILFLDELPEFKRSALEVMRQPLEDGEVSISRARMSVAYPSKFMLVASMNPSPSGDWYDPSNPGAVSPMSMQRYLSKISGPLLDRIDLHVEVNKVSYDELASKRAGESSQAIRARVIEARKIQQQRFMGIPNVYANAQMTSRMVRKICILDSSGSALLKRAINAHGLSARAYDRILKVARTIADLGFSQTITPSHIAEAIQYRSLDREGWNTP